MVAYIYIESYISIVLKHVDEKKNVLKWNYLKKLIKHIGVMYHASLWTFHFFIVKPFLKKLTVMMGYIQKDFEISCIHTFIFSSYFPFDLMISDT